MKATIALLLALLLGGCAERNISERYVLDARQRTGVISGSITYVVVYGFYELHLRSLLTGEKYDLEHGAANTLNPFKAFGGESENEDLGAVGSAFAVELPAGSYVMEGWSFQAGVNTLKSTQPTGVQFVVQPGRAIYLGNFHFEESDKVWTMSTRMNVTLADRRERDAAAIREQFPALAQFPISQGLQAGTVIPGVGGDSRHRVLPVYMSL